MSQPTTRPRRFSAEPVVAPQVSRTGLSRSARSRGDAITIRRAPPYVSHSRRTIGYVTTPYTVNTGSRSGTYLSDRWAAPSPFSFSIGRISDRWAGYITIGRNGGRTSLGGSFAYYGRDRRDGYQRYFHRGDYHYYRRYRPIGFLGYGSYRPWYGYSYASVYYPYRYYSSYPYYSSVFDDDDDTNIYIYNYDKDDDYQVYTSGGNGTTVVIQERAATTTTEIPAPAGDAEDEYYGLTSTDDETVIGQGNAAFLAERYEEARRFYISAVLGDERDGYAKFLYALANFGLGDQDVAGLALRRALLTSPALIDYPVDVRELYARKGLLKAQMKVLAKFVKTHPADPSAPLMLGYLHYAIGQPERAVAVLNPLIERDINDGIAAILYDAALKARKEKE